MEHLCDQLCYHLDIASFVACVNSGQPWSSKFSLLLSGDEKIATGSEDAQLDTFVENFVLERLSVQTPLRVRFHKHFTEYNFFHNTNNSKAVSGAI